jgi:hypothetical protein
MTAIVTLENPFVGRARFDAKKCKRYAEKLLDAQGLVPELADGRLDATWSGTGMFARQLEYIYTETFDLEWPAFKARKLVPVDNRVPSGAEFFTYRSYAKSGSLAEVTHTYTDDAPQGDVYATEWPQRIVSLRSAYGYSIQDMRAAAYSGVPLEAKKAETAREMIERKIEDLAAFGEKKITQPLGGQMYGLFNAPSVNGTDQVSSGTWQAQWEADSSEGKSTSIEAMKGDIAAMIQTIINQTKAEAGAPGTLSVVWPTPVYSFLATTTRNTEFDATGQTLLEYFGKVFQFASQDVWNRADKAASSGTAGRIMLYEKNPRVLSLIISQEFEQFAPQIRNMGFVIDCHARCGGVEVRYPLRMTYMDGPSP